MNKIEKFFENKGYSLEQLRKDDREYKVKNMDKVAERLMYAVQNNQHVHIIADYDVDGVMSGCIMYQIMTTLGADFTIRFPKKMSEGYGISEKIVKEIPAGSLVITVDNGIAAIEAIDLAKANNLTVMVLDHHQMRGDGILPAADIIVDPHITRDVEDPSQFEHYCGAGLSFMLAKELRLPVQVLYNTMALAAIATIQDVVPLVDDNRNIVKYGLRILNQEKAELPGLYSLMYQLKLQPSRDYRMAITEEDLAFQIGPCVNAMGRMLDDGAEQAFNFLMHYDTFGEDGTRTMVEWNQKRKEVTASQQNTLEVMADIEMQKNKHMTCMVVCSADLQEGVIGINAAKLCEKYQMPAIVFTKAEDGNFKGSARSVDDINLKECLDKVSEHILQYGGHAGAAGLTVEPDKMDDFIKAINKVMPKSNAFKSTWTYDFEVDENEIAELYHTLRKYAPYGEGFRPPVVKINNFQLVKSRYNKYYRYIGTNGVSLNGVLIEAVSFNLKEKFQEMGTPTTLNVVGTMGYSKYSKKPQIMINEMQEVVRASNGNWGYLI